MIAQWRRAKTFRGELREQFGIAVREQEPQPSDEHVRIAELPDARALPAVERLVRRDVWRRRIALDDHDLLALALERERERQPRDAGAEHEHGLALVTHVVHPSTATTP